MPIASIGPASTSFASAPPTVPATAPQRLSFAARLHAHGRAVRSPPASTPFAHSAAAALAHVDRAQARLDGVLAAARKGRTFTAAELIGLQAEAYRCAQTVDLASKLVEQGAQAVKQALNTQL